MTAEATQPRARSWRATLRATYQYSALICGYLLVLLFVRLSDNTVTAQGFGTFAAFSLMAILSIVLTSQVYSVATRMRCVICDAIFKKGVLKFVCEHRLVTATLSLMVGVTFSVELFSFLYLADRQTLLLLAIDIALFTALYRSIMARGGSTFTEKSAEVGRRFAVVAANYVVLYALYCVLVLMKLHFAPPPFAFDNVTIKHISAAAVESVNLDWRVLEWYVRTKYMIDVFVQSLTAIGGWTGAMITAVYVLCQSIAPFAAISVFYRALYEATLPSRATTVGEAPSPA